MQPPSLPFLTEHVSGTGGRIKDRVDDFRVDEIPAYTAAGEGDHVIAVIRKTGCSTYEAIKRIATALGVRDRDIGSAGLKDSRAVTTQQISLPPPTTPEAVLALEVADIDVLSAARHPHKLRTGHLKANRFAIVVRDCAVSADDAAEAATTTLEALAQTPGTPNWFGEQRFGRRGDNAEHGLALLRGEYRGRKPKPRILRLYLSAIQSLLFNSYLVSRVECGDYRSVIGGDVLKKTDSGGVFVSEEQELDAERLRRGEVVATGPMFGPKMKRAVPGSAAAKLEDATLITHELDLDAFSRYAKLTPGTRRPLSVALCDIGVRPVDTRAIEVSFTLPSGSYATSVVREITKAQTP